MQKIVYYHFFGFLRHGPLTTGRTLFGHVHTESVAVRSVQQYPVVASKVPAARLHGLLAHETKKKNIE